MAIGTRAARMLRSSAAWATSFAMSATSAMVGHQIGWLGVGLDSAQRRE